MEELRITNAIIEHVSVCIERGLLTVWLNLNYGGATQGFGGYKGDLAGHFIFRCLQVTGVEDLDEMQGKYIRVKGVHFGKIQSIGHIIKDDWFSPEEDFKKMKS